MLRRRAALLAASLLAVLAVPATALPATADTWVGWTTLVDVAPSGAQIAHPYVERTTGGGLTALGPASGSALHVVGSADGRVTAATVQRVVSGRVRVGLVVVVDGARRQVLADGVQGVPYVSADGRRIAVGRKGGDVTSYDVRSRTLSTACHRCTGFAASGEMAGEFERVALSPDGRYVAVRSYPGAADGRAILIWRIAGNTRVAMRTYGEDENDAAMSWTPDSRRVAYVANDFVPSTLTSRARVLLLGIDGRKSATPIWAPRGVGWFSGPLYLAGSWYLLWMPGSSPSGRLVQVLRTTSLARQPVRVGTLRTEPHDPASYVGGWWIASAPPAAVG